ncbi:MAG: hypothetical protein ACRD0U_11000, partial [Acidimicrobiales bacterium]
MASQLPDEATAEVHLRRAGAVADRARRRGRVAVIAACAALLVAPAAALSLARSDADPNREAPAQTPEEEFTCTGPPPFAGEVPEGATEEERADSREAEATAFEAWKAANCPDEDGDERESPPDGVPSGGDACAGPPPFAEVPAEEADPAGGVIPSPRADEATALAEARAACNGESGDDGPADVVSPEGMPSGPPEGTPGGPPEGTPGGPPEGTPGGPPEGTPGGPP